MSLQSRFGMGVGSQERLQCTFVPQACIVLDLQLARGPMSFLSCNQHRCRELIEQNTGGRVRSQPLLYR